MKAALRRTNKRCPVKGCQSKLFEDYHGNYHCIRCRRRFKKPKEVSSVEWNPGNGVKSNE